MSDKTPPPISSTHHTATTKYSSTSTPNEKQDKEDSSVDVNVSALSLTTNASSSKGTTASSVKVVMNAQERKRELLLQRQRKKSLNENISRPDVDFDAERLCSDPQKKRKLANGSENDMDGFAIEKKLSSKTPTRRGGSLFESSKGATDDVSPSLFGAVMNRARSRMDSNSPQDRSMPSSNSKAMSTSTSSLLTPTKSKKEKSAVSPMIGTPSFLSRNRSPGNLSFSSPGYTVLRVLEGINNPTPSRNENSNDASNPSQLSSLDSNGATLDDWYEEHLGILSEDVGQHAMDWGIKEKIKIQCSPIHCIDFSMNANFLTSTQHTNLSPLWDEVKSKPIQLSEKEDVFHRMWQSGLLYWQHPAHANVSQNRMEAASTSKALIRSLYSASLTETYKKKKKKQNEDHPLRVALHNLNSFLRTRHLQYNNKVRWSDWQEAFRSMYFQWSSLVTEWRIKDDKEKLMLCRSPSFYSLQKSSSTKNGKYQVIVFRILNSSENVVPVIVLSNISNDLAQKLLEMDVSLQNFSHASIAKAESNDKSTLPNKSDDSSLHHNSEQTMNSEKTKLRDVGKDLSGSINVGDSDFKQELETLRYASAHEETVGGEIMVKVNGVGVVSTNGMNPNEIDLRDPIVISGEEDCHAFFEAYLNMTPNFEAGEDVPLLVSRTVSSTLHATKSYLSVRICPQETPRKSTQELHNGSFALDREMHEDDPIGSIEIQGMILPCAVEQLMNSIVLKLLLDKHFSSCDTKVATDVEKQMDTSCDLVRMLQKDGDDTEINIDAENIVGSHYLVAHLSNLKGGRNLNGIELFEDGCSNILSQKSQIMTTECNRREIKNMIVWNVARPNAVMFKTEKVPNSI